MPQLVGTEVAGFEVTTDHTSRLVVARLWGLWPTMVSTAFGTALAGEIALVASPDYWLFCNASGCPPQGVDAQAAIIEAFHLTNRYRMRGRVVVVESPLTRLQFRRLLTEGGLPGFQLAKSEAEARNLLIERRK